MTRYRCERCGVSCETPDVECSYCADVMCYACCEYEQNEIGHCDMCSKEYELSDRVEHCGECGTCWDHCPVGEPHYDDEGVVA